MRCSVCGSEVKSSYIFCPSCGALVNSNPINQPVYSNQSVYGNQPVYSAPKHPQEDLKHIITKINNISSRKSFIYRFLLLLGLFSVIGFISLLCMGYFMLIGYGSSGFFGLLIGLIATVLSLIFSVIMLIIIRQIDIYEKEPWSLVIFSFLWGALGATLFSLIFNDLNSMIFTAIFGEQMSRILTPILSAPIFEEFFKLLVIPILIIFFRTNFNSPMDGLVYIFSSSLGFKIVEDLIYGAKFVSYSGALGGFFLLVLVRWLFGFLSHPLMSMFSGFALGLATITNNYLLKIVYIVMGYLLSVGSHFLWNFIAAVGSQFSNYLVCLYYPLHVGISIIIFISLYFIALNIDKKIMKESLKDDVDSGLIDYQLIDELFNFNMRRMRKNHLPEYKRRIYDVFMEELSSYALLKKQSINSLGSQILKEIQEKREILAYLKPYIYS